MSTSPSTSVSFARMPGAATTSGTSFGVAYASARATGGSFTGVTVIATAAGALNVVPSWTRNVNPSLPLKFGDGAYMRLGGAPLKVPCAGGVTIEYVSGLPSTSVPASTIPSTTSSLVATDCGTATGGSFTGVMVMVTVATSVPRWPSSTV